MRPEPVRLGILVPMQRELALLAGGFTPGRRLRPNIGEPTELPGGSRACLAGLGAEAARAATLRLLDPAPDLLVSFGFAGGLTEALPAGAQLLPASVLQCEHGFNRVGETLVASEFWRRRLGETLDGEVLAAPLVSSPRLVATGDDKAGLHRNTGASAVDMESYSMAELAADICPWVILRVVLDTAELALPDYLHPRRSAPGRPATEPGALAAFTGLLHRPASLPALLRLAQSFRLAALRLKLAAAALRRLAAGAP